MVIDWILERLIERSFLCKKNIDIFFPCDIISKTLYRFKVVKG
jgi:hypothetical protein